MLLKAFWSDAQGANHLGCVIIYVGALTKVSIEQKIWPEKVRKRRKSKVISRAFGSLRCPRTEDYGIPSEYVGGYV